MRTTRLTEAPHQHIIPGLEVQHKKMKCGFPEFPDHPLRHFVIELVEERGEPR